MPLRVAGHTAHQLCRDLRRRLSSVLVSESRVPAFQDIRIEHIYPRADNLEDMIAAYPYLDDFDYDNEPDCPATTIVLSAWLRYHATHCSVGCSATTTHPECYFKPLAFMLRTGFHPALEPGRTLSRESVCVTVPAYVDLWADEPRRCTVALVKLLKADKFIVPVEDTPEFCFPLLPVIKAKDIWRNKMHGLDYKVRLTSDSSTAGAKEVFCDIKFRYWGLDDIGQMVEEGDYLFTLDIKHFYNCLGAGPTLRRLQYFQDPRSYSPSTSANSAKVKAGGGSFLHQQTCMFGFKQLPWWASCCSSELARILTRAKCTVAGVIIDDFLFVVKAALGLDVALAKYAEAQRIMKALGVEANDKGIPPCKDLVFGGLRLLTSPLSVNISEEHREFTIDKIKAMLAAASVRLPEVRSLAGSLSWLCYVYLEGRPRRDALYATIRNARSTTFRMSADLRRQLRWWLATLLRDNHSRGSRIWSAVSSPPSVLCRCDASGDHGFGICIKNLHIFGTWRPSLASSILHDMLFKETLPFAIVTALIAPLLPGHIFAVSSDNAGMVFRVNAGSSNNPLVQRLLRLIARQTTAFNITPLADWNDREQPDAKHADRLSKTFFLQDWAAFRPADVASRSWLFDIIVHDLHSGKAFGAVFRLPCLD